MAVCEHRTKYGTISLIMNRLPRDTNEAIISCQFYCQAMHGFCVKFDHIVIKMDGNENNMKQTAYFKWECLEYGFEQVDFEWVIVIIHKAIKQVNAQKGNPKDDRNITEEIMTKHASEAEPIREILANDIPLHRFDSTHVCNVIRWWCMTDILFKSNLEKVMNLFSECSLSGVRIMSLSMKNIKRILKKDLLELMTPSTFGILLRKVKYWKTIQDENIIKQRAEEVGYLLCRYPADRLMERVCNKNDPISGIKVIQYYRRKNGWIKRITGWDDAQIYQIHAVLFKHGASLSKRIRQRAFAIFAQRFEYSIASKLRKCIRVYSDIDLETINYEFKNGHTDLQSNFTDTIMDFVSKHSKQSDGLRIYKAVVDCFIPNYTEMSENLSEYVLDLDESWTCCNCSNYNFSNYIDGKINMDLSICALCGISRRDAVIMVLKHYDTYTMVNAVGQHVSMPMATETDTKEDETIRAVIKNHNLRLFCLHSDDGNSNEACPSILRLAKQLLIYKNWISKINDNILSTTQVHIERDVNNDQFKELFMQSIQTI
eukprot:294878_1